jgi:tetratricopeptide (TPR) repeat protein
MGKPRKFLLGSALALSAGAIVFIAGFGLTLHQPASTAPAPSAGRSDPAPGQFDTQAHERKMLESALKKKPDHKPLLFRLAQLAEQDGHNDVAEGHLRAILKADPDDADAQVELSKLLFERGDINGALALTRHLLARQPDHADALYNLGAVYANLGNPTKARECWSRLIAAHPDSESAARARQLLPRLSGS